MEIAIFNKYAADSEQRNRTVKIADSSIDYYMRNVQGSLRRLREKSAKPDIVILFPPYWHDMLGRYYAKVANVDTIEEFFKSGRLPDIRECEVQYTSPTHDIYIFEREWVLYNLTDCVFKIEVKFE